MKTISSVTYGRLLIAVASCFVAVGNRASAFDLIWNDGTGPFVGGGQNWSYDNGGVVATTDNPFTLPGAGGAGGENLVLIGNGGDVTLSTPNQGPFMDNSLHELRVGTLAGAADLTAIGGPDLRGDGTLTVDNVGLILFDTDAVGTGNLIVGGAAGITGVFNWNSTEDLVANGQLRIGQGGTGVFNMNGGTVTAGNTGGGGKQIRVGSGGGAGTLNLNAGAMTLGAADDGAGFEQTRLFEIANDGAATTGIVNVGDGTGATGSASIETWADVVVSRAGTGVLNIAADGRLDVHYAANLGTSSPILVGMGGGGNGTINQTGGVLDADGLLQMGFNTGTAAYVLNGSAGMVNVRAVNAFATAQFTFNLDAGGATTITVEGDTNAAGDVAAGNSVTLANPALNVTGLSSYASSDPIVLFDQLDPSAQLTGTFGNVVQGQVVGQNSGGADFYLNLFGGDGNDIVLQSTLPSSRTDALVWNAGAANFDAGWASGNGSFGVGATGVDPFSGLQTLYLGNNGVATYDGTTDDSSGNTVKNLFVGTNQAAAVISGRNGNGTLTVNGSESLTVDDAGAQGAEGFGIVGESGFTGTLNWNSSGTLDVQGQFRVGRFGGTGVVNQTNGIVQGGTTGGGGKYMAVGDGAGSTGTYNLSNGIVYPDGLGAGSPLRQFRVGHDSAMGTMNIGDGSGGAGSALFESEDDLWVGTQNGTGQLTIAADGAVRLLGDSAEFRIGSLQGGAAGTGTVVQNGGTVTAEALFLIGQGSGAVGEYVLNGGSVMAANDGTGALRIGGGGGNGAFRISGSASFTSQHVFFVAQQNDAGTVGLLELTGSNATFQANNLGNDTGNDETISWIADAGGITPITIIGSGATDVVQLQKPSEATANTGVNGNGDLSGDGIALLLNLAALSGNQTLTLIDNQSSEAIGGFFENGTTMDLYEEGEAIAGTGFAGTVTISYLGGTGNDVVLNLTAGGLPGDFNGDMKVDGADFLAWQRGYPDNQPEQQLSDWQANYGAGDSPAAQAAVGVPEPTSVALACLFCGASLCLADRRHRTRRVACERP